MHTIRTIILHTHLPCLHFAAFHAFSNHPKRRRCDILTNFSLFDRVITILQHSLCAKIITGNLARRIEKEPDAKETCITLTNKSKFDLKKLHKWLTILETSYFKSKLTIVISKNILKAFY